MKYLFLYSLLLVIPALSYGQVHQAVRTKTLAFHQDSIVFDTLSIIPSKLTISLPDKRTVAPSAWHTKGLQAVLYPDSTFPETDSIIIQYVALPYKLEGLYYHKKLPDFDNDSMYTGFTYNYQQLPANKQQSLFDMDDLQKNGNVSRGISLGNAQDMSVASSLNLQLSGQLSEELDILASVSDQNIPIQPDGNTQQIQEFDKVYIQLRHQKGELTAGDFLISRPSSYYLNYRKKVQGARAEVYLKADENNSRELRVYGGAALSKGKYAVNQVEAIEGNQGPYKLQGNNLETYIIVIAGSEKVYIDGKKLVRGQSNDYVIDYNTAEVTFTAKQIITKDKRIRIEFEYTDRNYARSTIQTGVDYKKNNLEIHAHFYDESDLKNQSLDQSLSDEQKQLLAAAGDDPDAAVSSTVDSVGFFNDRVLYRKTDSLGYSNVYVYSINPDSAVYQLSFSDVGQGNGNYIQIQSAANGRVFKWVAPVGGISQGKYEPVTKLASPKKQQMLTFGVDYKPGKNTRISTELALSNHDLNLFSERDNSDNQGIAARLLLQHTFPLGKKRKWQLESTASSELEQANFNAIERYRSVEFNRNWNILNEIETWQHYSTLQLNLKNASYGNTRYQFGQLRFGNQQALQNLLSGHLKYKKWQSSYSASLTSNGNKDEDHSAFLRHRVEISRQVGSVRLGLAEDMEDNRYFSNENDSLSAGSYRFQSFKAYLENADSSSASAFRITAHVRNDDQTSGGHFRHTTQARELNGEFSMLRSRKHKVKATFTYRQLDVLDTLLSNNRADESSVARLEHRMKVWKGALTANSFYEAGSGMEVRKEYAYLEVAAGQGIYAWSDYNGNGIKELDEFEISAFPDEANYIRINIPTNDYIKTYGNQLSSVIRAEPSRIWSKSEKPLHILLRNFSNRTNLKLRHKSTDDSWNTILNPFAIEEASPELMGLNTNLRNTLYFRRSDPTFGAEFTILRNQYKNLLSNGFESQKNSSYQLYARYNITPSLMFSARGQSGQKEHFSEYFIQRNYDYENQQIKPELSLQISRKYRIRVHYQYTENKNQSIDAEQSTIHNAGFNFKYNQPQKGSWDLSFDYLSVSYNAEDNTAIAYELLNGYKEGDNLQWNLSYMRTLLDNMQLNISYNGRKSGENSTVHVGTVMLRAFF